MSLAAGANCTYSAKFTPATSGARTGQLTLTDNAAGSPQSYSLIGTGLAASPTPTSNPTPTPSPSGCTSGCNNYYVSPTGSDSNPGTQASPWKTINHAISAFTLGAGGTVINVAPGVYSGEVDINRGGGSLTQRLVIKCTSQWVVGGGAGTNCSGQDFVITSANYVDIGAIPRFGFEYSGNATDTAIDDINCTLTSPGPCPNGNSIHALGNYFHDMNMTTCPSAGAIMMPNKHGVTVFDIKVIGNLVDGYGSSTTGWNGCHGIYLNGFGAIIEDNIVLRGGISGISVYDNACNTVVSNNVIAHSGKAGMDINGGVNCTAGHNTVDNNIIVNNGGVGVNNGGGGPTCTVSTPNLFSNNIIFGNGGGSFYDTSSCNQIVNTKSENPTTTFLNYTGTAAGDYHLRAGSVAINGGATACVSGGLSPCTPTTDFSGSGWNGAIDIGVYGF